jgi:predicted transcriptional regulator
MAEDSDRLRDVVAQVASAYFSNSPVSPGEIPNVLALITTHFASIGQPSAEVSAATEDAPSSAAPTAAQIRKSVTHGALISFEDGRPYKTLRRHLSTRGLTPDEYRAKWGLPAGYPMVSAAYSATRSELAHRIGLGQIRQTAKGAAKPAARTKAAAPAKAPRAKPANTK